MSENRIKHRKIAVAAPWANGAVERVNRFVKSSLTKMLSEPSEWKKHVSKLQYVVNNTYHSGIESTPANLVFAQDQLNHADAAFAQFTQNLTNIDTDIESERAKAIKVARQATDKLKQYNKLYRDKRLQKSSIYKQGEYVLIT